MVGMTRPKISMPNKSLQITVLYARLFLHVRLMGLLTSLVADQCNIHTGPTRAAKQGPGFLL